MRNLLTRWRALSFGASCLVHLGLIAGVLAAERWIASVGAVRPPVLLAQLVTVSDEPSAPREIQKKPAPKRALATRARPAPSPATPLPQIARSVTPPPAASGPPPPETPTLAVTSEPASPSMIAATEPLSPSGPAVNAPATLDTASPGPAQSGEAAPARDAGATGPPTRSARPQGGYQVQPSYPSSALRRGIQGTTMLKVHVLVDGHIGDVVVQQSAGHPDLDQAAVDAVRRWRFEPARRGDHPVAMWVLLPVEFQIR